MSTGPNGRCGSAGTNPSRRWAQWVALVVLVGILSTLGLARPAPAGAATPTTITLSTSANPSVFGQRISFVATVKAGTTSPPGTVTFSDGATPIGSASLFFGKYTLAVSSLAVGTHQISATYAGGTSYDGSTATLTQQVGVASTSVAVSTSVASPVVGQAVTLAATVSATAPGAGSPTGTVTFTEGTKALGTGWFWAGRFTLTTSTLGVGTHAITASYGGGESFARSTGSLTISVLPATTTVTVTPFANPSVVGTAVTLTASTSAVAPGAGAPSGTVTFSEGATKLAAASYWYGKYTAVLPTLPLGRHEVTASYGGNPSFAASSTTFTLDVVLPRPRLTVTSSSPTSVVGQPVTFDVVASGADAGSTAASASPTGTVTLADGDTILATTGLLAGAASLTVGSLSLGSHDLTVSYAGDAGYQASTVTITQSVVQAASTMSVASSADPTVFGEPVTLTATVVATAPSRLLPSGTASFAEGDRLLGTVEVDDAGRAVWSTSALAAGDHDITVTYAGDASLLGSTTRHTLHVLPPPAASILTIIPDDRPTPFGAPVPVAVAVEALDPSGVAGQPTGAVELTEDGRALGRVALDHGTASFDVVDLEVGDHHIVATYVGDGSYAPSSSTTTRTVPRATSTVVVDPSGDPAVVGQDLLLTATVVVGAPGRAIPTGSVVFREGEEVLGTSGIGPDGSVRLSFPAAGVGDHTITASYLGDLHVEASSTDVARQVLPASTVLALLPSAVPAVTGQPVELVAAVEVAAPGSGTPTGTVTFVEDGTVLGQALLESGTARLVLPSMSVGDHVVTATYDGDGSFTAGTVERILGVVRAAVSIDVASSAEPSVHGAPAVLTIGVSAAGPGAGVPTGSVVVAEGDTVLAAGPIDAAAPVQLLLPELAVGPHALAIRYQGDDSFEPAETTVIQRVDGVEATVTMALSADRSVVGTPPWVSLVVRSPTDQGTPTGVVDLRAGDVLLASGELDGGAATLALPRLPVGELEIVATYRGDAVHAASTAVATHVVDRAPSTISIVSSAQPAVFGQPVTFDVQVRTDHPDAGVPSGTVIIAGRVEILGVIELDRAGAGTFVVSHLPAGGDTLSASYAGDASFAASEGDVEQQVVPAGSIVTYAVGGGANPVASVASVASVVSGGSWAAHVVVTAAAPSQAVPAGSLTVLADGVERGAATLAPDGAADVALQALAVGRHLVTVTYLPEATIAFSSSSVTFELVVEPAPTTVVLAAGPSPVAAGQALTLTAAVTVDARSLDAPTGPVEFADGAATLDTVATVDGRATLTTSALGAGPHVLTATYLGDDETARSTASAVVMVQAATTVAVTSSANPVTFGAGVTFTARVSVGAGGAMPTGRLTLREGNLEIAAGSLDNGSFSARPVALPIGAHTITATYGGDERSLPSSSTLTLVVDPVPTTLKIVSDAQPATFGQAGTLWATVANPTGAAAPGTVTFRTGTTVLGVATLFYGRYAIRLSTLPVGSHTIAVTYSGAGNDGPSNGTFLQTVEVAGTTIAVTSTANPTVATSPAMLQAGVNVVAPGGGAPVGSVTFSEGTAVLATVSAPFFGRYGLALGSLPVGTHRITVTFNGGPGYRPSSTSITQVIDPAATRITFTTSANPAGAFSDGTIQATVSPVAPAVGLPTGTLTFSEGGRVLASPPIFFGRYGLPLTDLPLGTHQIVATFTGTGNHKGSSAAFVQEIVRAVPKLTVSSSRNPAEARDGSYLSVMVTSLAGAMHDMTGPAGQGTVTFIDGGVPIGVVPVNGGRAHLSFLDLAGGTHTLVASYSGNDDFLPASSVPVVQTINAAATAMKTAADPGCSAAVAVGDSRLMGVGLLGRAAQIATGAGSPLANPPILAEAPKLQAIMGYRYGTFAHLEWVKAQKARCAGSRRFVTVLGPNHTLFPTYLSGDTRAWDPVDTAEMYALLDLMTTADAYGPAGSVVVGTFPYAPNAPAWGREAAAAHDQAARDYIAAHPDRDVQLLELDAGQITWVTGTDDWYHPTVPAVGTAPRSGQDELALQVVTGLARLHPELAAPATTTTIEAPATAPFKSDVTLTASVSAATPGVGLHGSVSFLEGAEVLATVPLDASGRAALTTDRLGVGDHQVRARFESAGGSFPSEGAATLTVDPAEVDLVVAAPPTAASSDGLVVAATVTAVAPSHGTPYGTVTIREGERLLGTGTYFFGTTYLRIASLPVGEHAITADFADAGYRASSATVTVTVTRDPTTVSLTGSAPELAAGGGDYLEAMVRTASGAANVAGTVVFTEDGRTLVEAPMWNGRAHLSLTAMLPGEHTITGEYRGDAQHEPSSTSLTISLATGLVPADRCVALVAIGDERLEGAASFGRLQAIATGGQRSPFVNDPLLLSAPLLESAPGWRDGDPAVLAAIADQRAACPDRPAAFLALLAPETTVGEPPATSVDALVHMLDLATGTDGPGQPGRVLVVSSPLPTGADPGAIDRVIARDLAVRDYIDTHPDREVHLLVITPAELEPSDAESARASTAVHPLDPATDADQLSYLVLAGAARTFVDLAAPRQDWVGPDGAERLVIYGDSGTALSTDVVTPIFQQAYRTHVAARPGFRYDQMLAFVDKVQASAGPEGAGDIVVVQGGTNDAIQASMGVWDLGRSPIVGSTFMDRNPQARCFVYVTAAAYSSAPVLNAASAELNAWMRDLPATDGRVQVADWDGLVRDYEARGAPDGPIILDDRLHPNPLGQRLLAETILDAAARCPAR